MRADGAGDTTDHVEGRPMDWVGQVEWVPDRADGGRLLWGRRRGDGVQGREVIIAICGDGGGVWCCSSFV